MPIRKQVYDLTADDLRKSPVWEYALDEEGVEGQDEATVRPYEVADSLDPSEGMFIVRARFTLADGTVMQGYIAAPSPDDESLAAVSPSIVASEGQVNLYWGVIAPTSEHIARAYALLHREAPQVFPLQFESEVDILGRRVSGTVPGFMYLSGEDNSEESIT